MGKIGVKKGSKAAEVVDAAKTSKSVQLKIARRQKNRTLEQALENQFSSGRLLAKITSRPGQCGRCDGVVLEGPELAFYQKQKKKKKKIENFFKKKKKKKKKKKS